MLGPRLHIDRRHRAAEVVGDEGRLPSGVTATPMGPEPTVMSVGRLVLVFTSIVDTEPVRRSRTKAVLPSGVTATTFGYEPPAMSSGCLVLVLTSIVDTEPLPVLATKAVLLSGVTATPIGNVPTGMSVAFLVLVLRSIVDTEPLPALLTNTVGRHCARAGTAAPLGTTPTSAPANPNTTTPRTHHIRAGCLAICLGHRRHGVTDTMPGAAPTGMSEGSLVLFFTSIVETVSLP